jgi:hypothetical protein
MQLATAVAVIGGWIVGYAVGRFHRRPRAISAEQFAAIMKFAARLRSGEDKPKWIGR